MPIIVFIPVANLMQQSLGRTEVSILNSAVRFLKQLFQISPATSLNNLGGVCNSRNLFIIPDTTPVLGKLLSGLTQVRMRF